MIITRAPLRVSFFGGGTDYPSHFLAHGGAVLGSAIDQYAFMTASRFKSEGLFDYSIRCSYREIEHVSGLDELRHVPIREALRYCGFDRDVELHHIADLPAKTGLGSSSSFVVSLLQALHKLAGREASGLDLAYQAINFERNILGESVGCQDQTFAAVGGFNVIEFRREDDITVTPIPVSPARMEDLEDHLMMFYTGLTRRAEDVVKTQLTKVTDNKDRYLRMRKQVDKAYAVITGNGSLASFGMLLDEAWLEKKALHSVISNSEIDGMYDRAKAAGALGGKLLGAGGGGFLMLWVPPERQAAVEAALPDHCLVRPRLAAPGSSVIFDGLKMRAPVAELRKVVG
jgi:D-glycero-alpha-D-manno-heptose-7-phosphate kinase